MVRSSKDLTGVTRPMKFVEKILIQQGFQRKGSKEEPVFRMNIQDASTRQCYLLDIPFKEENLSSCDMIRLGKPYVFNVSLIKRFSDVEEGIPLAITWAAESKLAEVADYLSLKYEKKG